MESIEVYQELINVGPHFDYMPSATGWFTPRIADPEPYATLRSFECAYSKS